MAQIIDTLAYIGTNRKLGLNERVGDYRKRQKEILENTGNDVKFIITAYSHEDNLNLSEVVSENPGLFLGRYIQINPNKNFQKYLPHTSPKDIENLIKSGNAVGLKSHTSFTRNRIDGRHNIESEKLAVEYGIPIVYHCAATNQEFAHPDFFRRVRDRNPDLIMVCMHYGGFKESYVPKYVKLATEDSKMILGSPGINGEVNRWILEKNPPEHFYENKPDRWVNFFLDTINGIQDQVVFGSDVPELHFTLHPINLADEKIQRKVTFDNAASIFRLEDKIKDWAT